MSPAPRDMSMEENLAWLTQPKPTLDKQLFDSHNHLLLRLQKLLLAYAQRVFELCVAPYQAFELADVVLCGSADSYFYHAQSDIDIKLVLRYLPQNRIFADEQGAINFISRAIAAFFHNNYVFKIDGRLLDFTAAAKAEEQQLYSIMQDCWLVEPSAQIMEGVDTQKVLAHAQKLKAQINHMLDEEFVRTLGKFDMRDIARAQALHLRILRSKSTTVYNLLLNKLLTYDGSMWRLHKFYRDGFAETLSL